MQNNTQNKAIQDTLKKDSIAPYSDEILQWTQHKDFAKFANSHFPPLLNPKCVDYHKIPCEIAWELNLPLPQRFQFVYWGSHGAGNTGLGVFLAKYGGHCFYVTNSQCSKANYCTLYNQILHSKLPKGQFGYLALRNFIDDKDSAKFHFLIYAKAAINLTRDPISMLRHYIKMRRYNDKTARKFSLGTNYTEIFPKLVGYTTKNGGGGAKRPA